jgi:amino acid adenylation domain-containing protein
VRDLEVDSHTQDLRLLPRQGLIWVDDQLFPDARYHNALIVFELEGVLETDRFVRAWAQVALGRDALRLTFDARVPRQFALDRPPPALPVVDVTADQVDAWIATRCARRFEHGDFMWDAALLRLAPDRHVFYMCAHHGLIDGLSQLALFHELADRYMGRTPEPAASFREYMEVETAYLASKDAAEDREYWERKLETSVPRLRPYGITREDRSIAVDRVRHDVGRPLAERLCARAREPAFASFGDQLARLTVVLSATAAFLQRIAGNREIVFAVPFANRTPRFARTCGLIMQQLFLRVRVEEGDTFASLAERIKTEFTDAVCHGGFCVSSRDLDYFRVNMMPPLPTRFGDLRARVHIDMAPQRAGQGGGRGDLRDSLALTFHDFAEDSLVLAFDCHAATYEGHVQQRMRAHFVRMLEALAADPDTPIETVSLVDELERGAVLRAARGAEPADAAPDVVRAFAAQLRRRADHVAVEGPDATLTYAQLDRLSDHLARRLRELGVGRESRVGVALPRSSAELVALLATLKVGGAYVPLDPAHPVERVRVILEDAAPQVLIARPDDPLAAALPEGAALLPLAALEPAASGGDAAPLDQHFDDDQLAYILFTSGSTGRPKGVEITRGAFANFLRSMAVAPGMAEHERLLAITTTTFDIAGLELFLPLWVGGTVVIADRDTVRDARLLRDKLEHDAISIMQATPVTWRLLLEAGYRGGRGLRMLCGGEALSPELADRLLAAGGELWNLYGPTETTVWSTLERVAPGFDRITIGAPIDGTRVYVLDAARQLVPRGCEGELWIGGAGVARGYHGRSDLTAQRFTSDPHAPGSRMYRTGDLGRLRDDGRFEWLGRADQQVKVRGFRIELGEVEAVMRTVPGVTEAVVVARDGGSAAARLCAYFTGEAEQDAVFARVRERLPEYMVPSAYLRLDAFPLTTSGKIDRKALPDAEPVASTAGALRAPETDLQRRMAAIWSDVLQLAEVGIDQDFFALGGTSLLAVELRNRVERELGSELPLRTFFEAPTIEGVLRALDPTDGDARSCLVRLTKHDAERRMFLIHDGDGDVLLYRNLAMRLPSDVAVYGVVPLAQRGLPMIHTTIPAMAGHFVREIRGRQPNGPYYLGGLCAGGVIAYEIARRLRHEGERVGLLALMDATAPQAKRLALRVTRQRLRRVGTLASAAARGGIADAAGEAARRLWDVANHELTAARSGFEAAGRMLLFAHVYSGGDKPWPKGWPVPRVRDIYMRALARYAPAAVAGVPAVLFRATMGVGGDAPTIEQYEDPRFGWPALLGDVDVLDVEGTHSSMLQEERVEAIAGRVRRAFERPHAEPRTGVHDQRPARDRAAPALGVVTGGGVTVRPQRRAVTVVIVSYRTAALVSRLLATIAPERSRCHDSLELRAIVIDCASGDAPALRAAMAHHGFAGFTTLIEAPRNGGFAYGNNLGLEHAYGTGAVPDYFLLLNPDTEVRPFAIERLVRFMERQPDAGVAGCSFESRRGERWPYAYRFPTLLSEVEAAIGWSLVTRALRGKVVARRVADAEESVDWIPGSALIVRREVVERLGGLDEGYFLYYEETDFCRKVKRAGYSVWYVPGSRVMHIGAQSTGAPEHGAARQRLPGYWFESRRRYFIKQHGIAYAIATDVATLAAYALGRLKMAVQGKNERAVPHYLRDLARHSTLLRRNRGLAPGREFRRDGNGPARVTHTSQQARSVNSR